MNALKKMNEAEVISSDGYKVKYGLDTLTYEENGRYLVIPIEHLGEPYEMMVHLNMAKHWMEKGKVVEQVSANEFGVIDNRIKECLNFLHRKFSVINN